MKLYVQYGDEASNQWQEVCELNPQPRVGLHPQAMAKPEDLLDLRP